MKVEQKDREICRPVRSSSIDKSRSHSLNPTASPPADLFNEAITQQKVSAFEIRDINPKCSFSSLQSASTREATELWMTKYQYVKRDNQLLQNQIVYLNQQIQNLQKTNQTNSLFFKQCLDNISKLFMKEISNCQTNLFLTLDYVKDKQKSIEDSLSSYKEKLALQTTKPQKKRMFLEEEENNDAFEVKLENLKLKSKLKVLEEEISQLDNKYLKNLEWNSQYLPSLEHFQKSFAEKIYQMDCNPSTNINKKHRRADTLLERRKENECF